MIEGGDMALFICDVEICGKVAIFKKFSFKIFICNFIDFYFSYSRKSFEFPYKKYFHYDQRHHTTTITRTMFTFLYGTIYRNTCKFE